MAKRSTRVEVTKVYKDGSTEVTLNKNKMNHQMCLQVINRLEKDWEEAKNENKVIKDMTFRCID